MAAIGAYNLTLFDAHCCNCVRAFLLAGILMSNVRNLLSVQFYLVASAGLSEAHHADNPLQG